MSKVDVVLIVDDDEVSSFVTTNVLDEMGVSTTIATVNDGAMALDYLRKVRGVSRKSIESALILLDLQMPIVSGVEFLQLVEKSTDIDFTNIKIVILTSSENEADKELASQFHISGFIVKPLTAGKLLPILYKQGATTRNSNY